MSALLPIATEQRTSHKVRSVANCDKRTRVECGLVWQIGDVAYCVNLELAISQGARFLTVKSLTTSNDDPNYARTRLFYEAIGFLPIEEFPTLRGPENPCLLMLLSLRWG